MELVGCDMTEEVQSNNIVVIADVADAYPHRRGSRPGGHHSLDTAPPTFITLWHDQVRHVSLYDPDFSSCRKPRGRSLVLSFSCFNFQPSHCFFQVQVRPYLPSVPYRLKKKRGVSGG